MQTNDLAVSCDGVSLGCSYIAPAADARGIVVLLHGIPSVNPPAPGDTGYPGWAEDLASKGWLTVWADLRAVRRSSGYFSLDGWVRDAIAVATEVRAMRQGAGLRMALVGSSAGGCVATEALRRGAPGDALALMGTPAAWVSFAGDGFAGLDRITTEAGMAVAPEVLEDPTGWAAEFDAITTEGSIGQLSVPTLIVHGTADDIVPVDHAQTIAAQAPHAEVVILDGAPHILRHDARARAALEGWLERSLT